MDIIVVEDMDGLPAPPKVPQTAIWRESDNVNHLASRSGGSGRPGQQSGNQTGAALQLIRGHVSAVQQLLCSLQETEAKLRQENTAPSAVAGRGLTLDPHAVGMQGRPTASPRLTPRAMNRSLSTNASNDLFQKTMSNHNGRAVVLPPSTVAQEPPDSARIVIFGSSCSDDDDTPRTPPRTPVVAIDRKPMKDNVHFADNADEDIWQPPNGRRLSGRRPSASRIQPAEHGLHAHLAPVQQENFAGQLSLHEHPEMDHFGTKRSNKVKSTASHCKKQKAAAMCMQPTLSTQPTTTTDEDHPMKAMASKKDQKKDLFVDATAMKEKVRQNVTKKQYNVADLYKEHGLCQYIARHWMFEHITLGVIAMNALWIWVDTDLNNAEVLNEADIHFQIMENLFCTYFSLEVVIRFASFRRSCDAFTDRWFCFDSVLVAGMQLETWVMPAMIWLLNRGQGGGIGNASVLRVLRVMRLTRMARTVRLLRAMPELLILIKGMVVAARSVFFTLCLLLVVLYFFGIALTQLLRGSDAGTLWFSSVGHAMSTLWLHGVLGENLPDVVNDVGGQSLLLSLVKDHRLQ
eukprot:TRINITY_DN25836_c0_g1_i3.p1 TRINITY_DN25836_c0_g1~~TRINITY_DN25836_c0_g1_i3.p1  ORF type:complete len:574 (-),score=102.30 TRINITY_DN25836_c0_g1_i3:27-1748(-)